MYSPRSSVGVLARRACGVCVMVACVGACAAESYLDASEGRTEASPRRASVWPTDAGRPATDAGPRFGETYFASVTGTGAGCPEGSWKASIQPTSESIELSFSAFELTVASGAAPAVRDCLLRIRLRGARALSYAFRDAQYTGVAELDEGVVASQVVRSWSQGREATAREQRNTLSGPYDAPYAVKGEARPADLVWSTCAREVELSVHVALRVEPDQRRGQGYVQLTKLSALRIGAAECAR